MAPENSSADYLEKTVFFFHDDRTWGLSTFIAKPPMSTAIFFVARPNIVTSGARPIHVKPLCWLPQKKAEFNFLRRTHKG
jgi:hypothetical protein